MAGSSVTFVQKTEDYKTSTIASASSKKSQARTSVFDSLGSHTAISGQRSAAQEQSFRAGAGRGARHRPYPDQRGKTKKTAAASTAGRH